MREATEPISMSVISEAANALPSPAAVAIQLAEERHVKTTASMAVVRSAAVHAQRWPSHMSPPHAAESAPKTDPETSAVIAASGLDR